MNKRILFALWGGLFALCAGLGFVAEPAGFLKFLLTALSVGFFVPPLVLLHRCGKAGDRDTVMLIRNLAALSLGLTVALLIGNFLSVFGSEVLGDLLYSALVIVSTPMVCSRYWAVSLFLWACVMIAAMRTLRK